MTIKYKNNILSAFLALTLLATFNVYFYPSTAKAQQILGTGASTVTVIGVTDIGTVAANKANVTTAVSQKASFGQTLLEWSKKMLGIVLKRAILDRIVDQTVAWIQNDFKGKPPFMENPEAFKKQVIDNAVGAAIQSIAPGLCSPFSIKLQIGIVGPAKLSQGFSCTLSDVVSNINNFEGEFSEKGGKRWLQYAAIWEPQNNLWGATIMAQDLKDKTAAQVIKEQDLSQTVNLGFTPTETCTPEYVTKTAPCQEGTPNCTCSTGTQKVCTKEVATKCTQGIEGCTCKIKTPGNFIASEVFGIASSNTQKNAILSADDVATYVGTLLDAIISHYTQLGMRGLMGVLYPEQNEQPGTEWDVAVRKAFSSLDAMTYKNTKTMYLDEIQGVLDVKNKSFAKVEALIEQENGLSKLAVISVCPLADDAQKADVANIIAGSGSALSYLSDLKDTIESNIDDMNSVKVEMQNSEYPVDPNDPSGQAEQYASLSLLAGYQDLKDRKILDLDAANKESDSILRVEETRTLNATKAHGTYDSLADSCVSAIIAGQKQTTP